MTPSAGDGALLALGRGHTNQEPSMPGDYGNPFGSIESTYDYISLLGEALNDSRASILEDLAAGGTLAPDRRQDALHLIKFKLDQLDGHITASRRILNDLRTLRRMLLGERQSPQSCDSRDNALSHSF